jgi:hypothetical protein
MTVPTRIRRFRSQVDGRVGALYRRMARYGLMFRIVSASKQFCIAEDGSSKWLFKYQLERL